MTTSESGDATVGDGTASAQTDQHEEEYPEAVDAVLEAVEEDVGSVPEGLSRGRVHQLITQYVLDYQVDESMAVQTVSTKMVREARSMLGEEGESEEHPAVEPTTPSTDTPTGPVGGPDGEASSDPHREIGSLGVDDGDSDVGKFVTLTGEVRTLYSDTYDTVVQKGVITDGTGTIEVTVWKDSCAESPVETLEEGEAYEFEGLKIGAFQNEPTASTVTNTTITGVDESFERPTVTVQGPVVKVEPPSGLISRCTEEDCTRVLDGGLCSEHGEIDNGEVDLRLKAVIDTGDDIQRIVLDETMVSEKFSLDVEGAQEFARENGGDPSVVEEALANSATGVYFEVSGVSYGEYLMVDSIAPVAVEDLAADSLASDLEAPVQLG